MKPDSGKVREVPFFRSPNTGRELSYIHEALTAAGRQGGGPFTERCQALLRSQIGGGDVLLTQSCTAALEMAGLLARLQPGDEVILPSYTFVSTANAVVLRGAVPVFVDIDPRTQNLDPGLAAAAIGPRTKAICVVHYGGIGADVAAFRDICRDAGIVMIEDAAQAIGCSRDGVSLGHWGALAAFSFHDTKNLSSGEGGALVVHDPEMAERAHILWEKGTNRRQFTKGLADKYTWVDVGSSFLPSEVTAAMLYAQLESREQLLAPRHRAWQRYHTLLAELETAELVTLPHVPPDCVHNGHLYYLILANRAERDRFIAFMAERRITCPFHYVPLHGSPAGQRFGTVRGPMTATERAGDCLVRLPIWATITDAEQDTVIDAVKTFFSRR